MVLKFLARIAAVAVVLFMAFIGIVWWFFGQETNQEAIGKSPAEMRDISDLPFPADASNIHYFFHAGGMQDLQMFGKFDCPASRADDAVADLISYNDRQLDRSNASVPARRTVTATPFGTVGSGDFKIGWWDLDERKVRKAILLNQSYLMQFWIEPSGSEGSTVYFYQND